MGAEGRGQGGEEVENWLRPTLKTGKKKRKRRLSFMYWRMVYFV